MMEHELHITVKIINDKIITTIVEPESGEEDQMVHSISIDDHSDFDVLLGAEIYSWIQFWGWELKI